MRLYYAAGVYVGTQADAKRLDKDFTQVEVPVDKDGLMAFLNRHKIVALAGVAEPSPTITAPPLTKDEAEDVCDLLGLDPEVVLAHNAVMDDLPWKETKVVTGLPPEAFKPPMDAGSVLSRMDTPGIEQMIEAIAVSKGASLRRFAGAVAIRFAELAK